MDQRVGKWDEFVDTSEWQQSTVIRKSPPSFPWAREATEKGKGHAQKAEMRVFTLASPSLAV